MVERGAVEQDDRGGAGGSSGPVLDRRIGPHQLVRVQKGHLFLSEGCSGLTGVAAARAAASGTRPNPNHVRYPKRDAANHGGPVRPVTRAGIHPPGSVEPAVEHRGFPCRARATTDSSTSCSTDPLEPGRPAKSPTPLPRTHVGRGPRPQRQIRRPRAVAALRLRPGDTVLDVGCGTGLCFPWIQDRIGPSGKLIAVEPSREMLDKAMQRVAQRRWDNVIPINAVATEFDVAQLRG